MLDAYHRTGKAEYLDAAKKGGDFFILAQMPEPQPAWAQQYNFQVEPVWGRKFEPPAIATRESAEAIRVLVDLFLYTGQTDYLATAHRAADWLRASRMPDGQWARFYELQTNQPLYVNANYEIDYTTGNLLKGYGLLGVWGINRAMAYVDRVERFGRDSYLARRTRPPAAAELTVVAAALEPRVNAIIAELDAQGRWVKTGTISMAVFNENMFTLARYVTALQGRELKFGRDAFDTDSVWNPQVQ